MRNQIRKGLVIQLNESEQIHSQAKALGFSHESSKGDFHAYRHPDGPVLHVWDNPSPGAISWRISHNGRSSDGTTHRPMKRALDKLMAATPVEYKPPEDRSVKDFFDYKEKHGIKW